MIEAKFDLGGCYPAVAGRGFKPPAFAGSHIEGLLFLPLVTSNAELKPDPIEEFLFK